MGIASIAKSGLNYAGRLILDDRFARKVTSSLKDSGNYYKQAGKGRFYKFDKQLGKAFQNADKYTSDKKLFQSLKDSITSYGKDTAALWKGNEKFLSKLGGTFKGLWKRAPLLGAITMLAFELPNIFKASKDGGLINGGAEAAKSGVRIAAGVACGAVGSAILSPVGGIAGFLIGDLIGKLVVGKSYSEKISAQQQRIADTTNSPSQFVNPVSTFPQMTLSPQDLMVLQQLLYNKQNNDFLYNTINPYAAQNKLNITG